MIPVRVSFWYEFIPVLTYRSVFVYMIPGGKTHTSTTRTGSSSSRSYLSLCVCLHDTGEKSHASTTRAGTRFYM